MFKDYTLQTTWMRALAALVGGAVVGAVGITFLYLPGHWTIWNHDAPQILKFWVEAFAANLYYFSIALFLGGPPLWALAHWFGFRTRISAVTLGLALSIAFLVWVVTMAFWYNVGLKSEVKAMGSLVIIFPFVAVPLIGAMTADTIWRIAYRRPGASC